MAQTSVVWPRRVVVTAAALARRVVSLRGKRLLRWLGLVLKHPRISMCLLLSEDPRRAREAATHCTALAHRKAGTATHSGRAGGNSGKHGRAGRLVNTAVKTCTATAQHEPAGAPVCCHWHRPRVTISHGMRCGRKCEPLLQPGCQGHSTLTRHHSTAMCHAARLVRV
jgi:hypothetical protein